MSKTKLKRRQDRKQHNVSQDNNITCRQEGKKRNMTTNEEILVTYRVDKIENNTACQQDRKKHNPSTRLEITYFIPKWRIT